MVSKRLDIFEAALSMDAGDRTELIERLLDSLDESHREHVDRAWADEAERRLGALDRGEVESIEGEAVLRVLRSGQRP